MRSHSKILLSQTPRTNLYLRETEDQTLTRIPAASESQMIHDVTPDSVLLLQAALLLKIALLQLLLLQTALLPQTHLLQHELLLVPKQACSLLQTA